MHVYMYIYISVCMHVIASIYILSTHIYIKYVQKVVEPTSEEEASEAELNRYIYIKRPIARNIYDRYVSYRWINKRTEKCGAHGRGTRGNLG